MALTKPPLMTPEKIAANRENARRSTGPRTPAGKQRSRLNALKHGAGSQAFEETIVALGEDPRAFRRLRRDFLASFDPATPFERTLVEDLARLWWQKLRLDRSQAGLQVESVECQEHARRRAEIQGARDLQESAFELREIGLRRAQECPAKFEQVLMHLDHLVMHLQGTLELNPRATLVQLYGHNPTQRSLQMDDLCADLLKLVERRKTALRETGKPPAVPPGFQAGGVFFTEDTLRKTLRVLVAQEMRDVIEERDLYLHEQSELSRTRRDAFLAPADKRWTWVLRQGNSLDRQFDRKLRQLERLQAARANHPRRGPEPEVPPAPDIPPEVASSEPRPSSPVAGSPLPNPESQAPSPQSLAPSPCTSKDVKNCQSEPRMSLKTKSRVPKCPTKRTPNEPPFRPIQPRFGPSEPAFSRLAARGSLCQNG